MTNQEIIQFGRRNASRLSLLQLTILAITIVENRALSGGEAVKLEAFRAANYFFGLEYGEFAVCVKEGKELGVIVDGAFDDSIKSVQCDCMDCEAPAFYRSELDPDEVICNVCREIELDQL